GWCGRAELLREAESDREVPCSAVLLLPAPGSPPSSCAARLATPTASSPGFAPLPGEPQGPAEPFDGRPPRPHRFGLTKPAILPYPIERAGATDQPGWRADRRRIPHPFDLSAGKPG